ncbi:MAG: Stp1/IreP family PP2C-type Ser/Thr phosphatase [Clostridia bacterium]|nr:Stp1/IreP family PP2C-type Ser/Thr phosphatase [Clostridia bacterium]
MNIVSATDIGKVRKINEDSFEVFRAADFEVMVVADGMGGHNAGEVASAYAVKTIKEYITENAGKAEAAALLKGAIAKADSEILKKAGENAGYTEMGTTVVMALIKGFTVFFANVGDSRGYVMDKFGIKQITADDSVVAELVRRGEITPDEAKTHPQRNIITQAVGTKGGIEPRVYRHVCKAGDTVLLCSDGLTNMLGDDEIFETVKRYGAKSSAQKLIEFANDRGGADNITLTAAEFNGGNDA